MKIKLLALIGIILLLITGCNTKADEVYQESIQKGMDAVAEDEFSKAEGLFEMALEAKEDDELAKAYLEQIQYMIKADDLVEQGKIEEAIQSLDQSIDVKDGSKVISAKSKDKKESLLAFQENQKNYNTLLTDAKDLAQASNFQDSNVKLDELLKADLTSFENIKNEATTLKEANLEAIRKAEIAKAEEEAKAKAAEAEKEAKKDIQPDTLSADDVEIHFSIFENGELELLTQSVILKVGQRLVLTRDDKNDVSDRIMFSSNGTIDVFDNTDGFVAIAPGTTTITIIPAEDWDISKEIEVTVIN